MAGKNPLKVIFHFPDGTTSRGEIKIDYISELRTKINEAASFAISDESYIALSKMKRSEKPA